MNTDKYKWHILNSLNKTETGVPEFSKKYNITEELAKILMNRGIDDESKLSHYLFDSAADLGDPFLMKGMPEAVDRILRAIDGREKIVMAIMMWTGLPRHRFYTGGLRALRPMSASIFLIGNLKDTGLTRKLSKN